MKLIFALFLLSAFQYNDATFETILQDDKILQDIASEISLLNIAKQSSIPMNDINKDCSEDLRDVQSLNVNWAWRMIDSAGKIPHGILRFNFHVIGQYRECIETSFKKPSGREITGRHCMLANTLTIPRPTQSEEVKYYDNFDPAELGPKRNESTLRITINTGICFPSACSPSEIDKILSNIPSKFPLQVKVTHKTCSTQRTIELSPSNIGTIAFLSAIGFIMLYSTLYDLWYQIVKRGDKKEQKQLFVAFSVYTNSRKIFTPSKNPGPLACLHGMRVLSILWIVLGHRYLVTEVALLENYRDMFEWFTEHGSSIIGGSTVTVDTFFLMSGILLSYVFFRSAKIKNVGRDLPVFYIHRILRLTPLLAAIILLYVTLMPLYGNGPYKYISESVVQACQKNWWFTLLYVQNYALENVNICIGQSWYLAVDMQLYIISPLILYPLLWNKKVGIVWLSICIAAAQSLAFAFAYINEWPAGILNRRPDSGPYVRYYYNATHTRATPYLIGVLAGYLLLHSFKKNNITTLQYKFIQQSVGKQCLIIVGWICSLTILGAVLFGYHPLNQPDHVFSHWEDTVYNAFSRTAWTLGLLWIIVACAYGYGGVINWFLSLTIWEILGRFTFAVYLIHTAIQVMLVTNRNHVTIFDHMTIIYDFFGDVVACYAISFILILAFESPIVILEKIIFKKGKTENVPKTAALEKVDLEKVDELANCDENLNNPEKVNGLAYCDEKVNDSKKVNEVVYCERL